MKYFRERSIRIAGAVGGATAALLTLGAIKTPALFQAGSDFSRWIENVPAGSAVESALFRAMQLPNGEVPFRRPPRESVPALSDLQKTENEAALLSLRALEEEQALDFAAAEDDWKAWAAAADDRVGAHLDLANFYERRLQPNPELAALEWVGSAPPDARERWTAVEAQRSWKAFERALKVVDEYALGRAQSDAIYAQWMKRYRQEPAVYRRRFEFLLAGKNFPQAEEAIAQYRSAFPQDRVFPLKSEADLAVGRGNSKDGLAVYDASFEPLWPPDLIHDYFRLILDSHEQRAFRDAARARLEADPDDLKDAARLFYLEQQQGQLDAAKAVLNGYREKKEARGAAWTPEELTTLEKLFEAVQDFPEAARYAYAMAAQKATPAEEREGTVGLARILLTAPEQPLRVGAGNLSLYRDIATMDRGPGYLNGILSLFLNTQGPDSEYNREEQLAAPYFHRAKAAELLAEIDRRFPDEPSRPMLHAKLMEAYGKYGDSAAVIREGMQILADFPHFDGRTRVALELADAYERTHHPDKEFGLYQELLKELAAQADGVPLGGGGEQYGKPVTQENALAQFSLPPAASADNNGQGHEESADAGGAGDDGSTGANSGTNQQGARSVEYAQVLDRYLARLVALQRLPDALAVLRSELDRNPQDPGLYVRLADFLEQNRLNAHVEEVYERAIAQFQDTGWYARLARLYLRQRRAADYRALMQKVAEIFSGTELEAFLTEAPSPDRSLAFEVDEYAAGRFPHEMTFVRRLLSEYDTKHDDADAEKLLWANWAESPELRDRLLELLSRTDRLDGELAVLRQQSPEIEKADWGGLAGRNPAAERFWVEACLWQSHYEQAVGAADALASAYPADAVIGAQASSLYRSLAYFHPEDTDKAVAVEKRLFDARPGDLATLARIGDIYADRNRFTEAVPYWLKMADVRPGETDGYLQSATVFWDYFDFADAQAQLERAQARLHDPTLFGYQQGAIEESRGDVATAIRAYVASATAANASSDSRDRLLTLAHRPGWQVQVEAGTAGLLRADAPRNSAIELRAGVLEAEHHKDQLAQELQQLVARTTSFDVLEAVARRARTDEMPAVEEASLRRQVTVTSDPVRKLQLRYRLVDELGQRDAAAAAHEIDAIYSENPKILGVVRSTVDYDWDHDRRQQAVIVLLDAAGVAYPDLRSRFQLEAARKSTDLGDYARSRTLLEALLKEKPLDAGYETAMAANLARASDQAGLDTFYRAQLELVRNSPLGREEKQARVAQLRRGIVAADTELRKFDAAVDQYIALINTFPEDGVLAQEAALYAVAHDQRDRLFAFYQKAIADSPRDARWSIVLARLATAAEDDSLAIDAYAKALRLRPERQDLYIAQAGLDERLRRFDDAIGLYRKLYTLSYRDPKWMLKVAELSARERKEADTVSALETALIEGRAPKPAYFFEAAEHLESWGMLPTAQKYAERGVELAGPDLLVTQQGGAATYARIMARLRQTPMALALLKKARADAPAVTIAAVAQQVAHEGPGAITGMEWRKQREQQRREQATAGFAQALQAMAGAAEAYYTPEERMQLAALLRDNAPTADATEIANVYLPAAKAAQLAQLTGDLEWAQVVNRKPEVGIQLGEWLDLETRRGQSGAAARQLEKLAPGLRHEDAVQVWRSVANAYRKAGDAAGELRAMEQLGTLEHLEGGELSRFYKLLIVHRPEELLSKARAVDSAAQYLVRNGSSAQAFAAVDARAAARPPVWKDAYTALTGLYLREQKPAVNDAFREVLAADASIGDRSGHPADRQRQLAGTVWFYYGARYAEYLDGENDPQREDYEASELEATPGNPAAYMQLADQSAEHGRADAALLDYSHSLDLNGDQPSVLDKIATIEWKKGDRTAALAAWSNAVKLLAAEMDARQVPETFWGDFGQVLKSISTAGQFDAVRAQVDAMLRVYLKRNGTYRSEPLLAGAYRANGNSVDWLLNITASPADQQALLWSILPNAWSDQGQWIEKSQLSRIYARTLELAEKQDQAQPGNYGSSADSERQKLVLALLNEKQTAAATQAFNAVSQKQRYVGSWLPIALRLADADGSLGTLVGDWKSHEGSGPALNEARSAAGALSPAGRRILLRYVYETSIARRDFSAANFLGLAEIDLEENNTGAAVALLKRLALVSADMYADEDSAAHLLERHHKAAEAAEFLRELASANPWVADYRVRLAKTEMSVDPGQSAAVADLNAVAADPNAKYEDREQAARALNGHGAAKTGSGELDILAAATCPSAASVSQPLYVAARLQAADCSGEATQKEEILREALAIAPDDPAVRLKYVFAAFAARSDARALAAAAPYMQGGYYPATETQRDAENETNSSESPDAQQEDNNASTLAGMPPTQAARLIELTASANQRRGDLVEAVRVVSLGLNVVHAKNLRAPIERRRATLQTELDRSAQNDMRAPKIQDAVEQGGIVRPRLLPGMPIPDQPAREEQP